MPKKIAVQHLSAVVRGCVLQPPAADIGDAGGGRGTVLLVRIAIVVVGRSRNLVRGGEARGIVVVVIKWDHGGVGGRRGAPVGRRGRRKIEERRERCLAGEEVTGAHQGHI